ncbi:hypothetical protein WKV53_13685 [Luteolibacter sp. Y139]|uniref:Uncharacterized protein n=2 Tax=Luteolibacter soli TaxID=3135280 RepID=A0ABU9AXS9_9BACT
MIRPFHRWKSLWLGLLVLIFLAWSWHRSIHHYDAVIWGDASGQRGISLNQHDSKIFFTWVSAKTPVWFEPGIHPSSTPITSNDKPLFPSLSSIRALRQQLPPSVHAICLPHWLLTSLFLAPWSALLVWRWRRLKRLTALQP